MDDLPHGPSTIAVRSVELFFRETCDRFAQARWCLLDVIEMFRSLLFAECSVKRKFADRISWVCHPRLLRALNHRSCDPDSGEKAIFTGFFRICADRPHKRYSLYCH